MIQKVLAEWQVSFILLSRKVELELCDIVTILVTCV